MVSHLCEKYWLRYEIRKLEGMITYKVTQSYTNEDRLCYLAFSNAGHGHNSYGQNGYFSGLYFQQSGTFHVIDWHSCMEGRVPFRPSGWRSWLQSRQKNVLLSHASSFIFYTTVMAWYYLSLTLDSHGLYTTITALHDGTEYRLRPTYVRLLNSVESGEISVIQLINGINNIPDGMTKRNAFMLQMLNNACTTEKILGSFLAVRITLLLNIWYRWAQPMMNYQDAPSTPSRYIRRTVGLSHLR